MLSLLSDPKYSFALTYLDGNVMNEKDLARASAQTAKTVFVLTNKLTRSPDEEDASTILRALSVKRYVQQKAHIDIQTCLQLILPESKKLYMSTAENASRVGVNQIVCIDEIKMNLLAKSCLCPGTSTMLCNLISSSGYEPDDDEEAWVKEYCEGCGYEIYRVPLSPAFEDITFLKAAQIVYDNAGCLMFALELNPARAESRVILNPGRFIIPNVREMDVHAFVIAEDREAADIVTNIEKCGEGMAVSAASKKRRNTQNDIFELLQNTKMKTASQRVVPLQEDTEQLAGLRREREDKEANNDPSARKDPVINSDDGKVEGGGGGEEDEKEERADEKAEDTQSLFAKDRPKSSRDLSSVDTQFLKKMYHYTEEPRTLADCTVSSLDEIPGITGHVILIGTVVNLAHFVLPMRSRHLEVVAPVVIMHPNPPSRTAWSKLANFTDVWYLRGSAYEISDLRRAKIDIASRVVIFAKVGITTNLIR